MEPRVRKRRAERHRQAAPGMGNTGARHARSIPYDSLDRKTTQRRFRKNRRRRNYPLLMLGAVLALIIVLGGSEQPEVSAQPATPPNAMVSGAALPTEHVGDEAASAPVVLAKAATVSSKTARVTPLPATPAPTAALLKAGMEGEAVRALQEQLIGLGYLSPGSADGKYGNGTKAAVKALQVANGLEADGVAGEKTLQLLSGGAAKAYASPTATVKTASAPKVSATYVYVATSGNGIRYHVYPGCSNMKGTEELTVEEATARGFTPCQKKCCYGR